MTLSAAERDAVVHVRLATAVTTLEDAQCLLDRGSIRSAANRAYYSVFYAVSALAIHGGKVFRTHTGLIAFLHSEFVAPGKLESKFGRVVQEAFEDRSEADYEDVPDLAAEQIAQRLEDIGDLIRAIRVLVACERP